VARICRCGLKERKSPNVCMGAAAAEIDINIHVK